MGNKYLFEDRCVGISELNIDLLRNGFVYDKIEYCDIKEFEIKKRLHNYWFVQFSFGLALLTLSFLIIFSVYDNSTPSNFVMDLLTKWYGPKGSGLIAVLFLLVFGGYVIIESVQKSNYLIIVTNAFRKILEIEQIDRNEVSELLSAFLKEKVDQSASV
jgi:hypothetical protein